MKNQTNTKPEEPVSAIIQRKSQHARGGAKTFAHRYERRKIREQLRHLDWALPGAD